MSITENMQHAPASLTAVEMAWGALATALTVWSLFAIGVAQTGLFQGWALLVAGLIAYVIGWAFFRAQKPGNQRIPWREIFFLSIILVMGLLLFVWPAEHFPLLGDSAIYPNTAALLIRTGGLTYHYDPLDGLTWPQKQLFYVPSDRQLPGRQIQSYRGLLYGAYYVMDPSQNTIVSSRPPLAIVWMGLLGMLLGERGMLYVTPIFGVASLLAVYFLGKRVFDEGTGALAALWLALSFPQLHFSRTPYAEVVGQFFVLTALYGLVVYLQTRQPWHCALGLASLTAAFATRIDTVLALPTLLLFAALLVMRRDRRGLAVGAIGMVAAVGFTVWTINRPYAGATGELLLAGQLQFLHQLDPRMILGLGGLLGLALFASRHVPASWLRQSVRGGLSLTVVLGVGYSLYIRPLMPEYVLVNGELLPAYNEELMAVAAQYLSPLFFWLAALGVVLVLWQDHIRHEHALLVVFVASFGTVFFWKYTTATVYPVALRRLVPEVLPGFSLLAAFALSRVKRQWPRWRWGTTTIAGLVLVFLVSVATPYWFYREAVGTWDFLGTLAGHFPADAVVLFEPQQGDSIAGWFAAPLWSFYQRRALLLNSNEANETVLRDLICSWQRQGREVYVISQQDPSNWWPGEFKGHKESEVVWDSSIIGQSRFFPPYVWRFVFTLSIYRWEGTPCSSQG